MAKKVMKRRVPPRYMFTDSNSSKEEDHSWVICPLVLVALFIAIPALGIKYAATGGCVTSYPAAPVFLIVWLFTFLFNVMLAMAICRCTSNRFVNPVVFVVSRIAILTFALSYVTGLENPWKDVDKDAKKLVEGEMYAENYCDPTLLKAVYGSIAFDILFIIITIVDMMYCHQARTRYRAKERARERAEAEEEARVEARKRARAEARAEASADNKKSANDIPTETRARDSPV